MIYINLKKFSEITGIKASTLLSYKKRGAFPKTHVIANNNCYLLTDVLEWERPKKNKPGPKDK